MINNQEHSDLCVGIDLGTTNSVLATINKKPNGDIVSKIVDISRPMDVLRGLGLDKTRMSSQKRSLLPSCVYYDEQHGLEPVVGDFAKMQYPNRPHLVARSIKSQMGNAKAEGLAEAVPDKTPAEVSARILKHMLKEAGKVYRQQITDAVITVPANFDTVMCQATRDAAALAGIKIKNADGSERPVLLSEPNAVIYDLINQIQNGEISGHIIDLNTGKNVIVFDLGGGTLDITMHRIQRREDCPDVLKVDEIATNRYTRLGGDDFDEAIAEAMYRRYLQQYSKYDDVQGCLEQQRDAIMPVMRNYAEQLKLEVSERYRDGNDNSDSDFGWDDGFDDGDSFEVGGNIGGIGYAYDDCFNKEEVEAILRPFMGAGLCFADYKNAQSYAGSNNIINPILDVLQKAEKKLQTAPKVDAVIVNGGMSKFYMIIDRLKEFFGLEPIVALDSDLAVARGAAVYHYYLHLYEESMQQDMRMLYNTDSPVAEIDETVAEEDNKTFHKPTISERLVKKGIEFGKTTLNDDLYLGVRNGAVQLLIPAGAELPYESEIIKGFVLDAGCNEIEIPIKMCRGKNEYATIASGRLKLGVNYGKDVYVAIIVKMDSSKVVTMNMILSEDLEGNNILARKTAQIVIGCYSATSKVKMAAPEGASLNVHNELNKLQQLCDRLLHNRGKHVSPRLYEDISFSVKCISKAGNKEEFSWQILHLMQYGFNSELKMRLFIIAKRQCPYWSEERRASLATICLNQLSAVLHGFNDYGFKRNLNLMAIYTLSWCGNKKDILKLNAIKNIPTYRTACLYAFGKNHLNTEWIYETFYNDVRLNNLKGLQTSAHAMGLALRRDEGLAIEAVDIDMVIELVCQLINNNIYIDPNHTSIVSCALVVLGYACDQRFGDNIASDSSLNKARHLLGNMESYYLGESFRRLYKAIVIAQKMLDGTELNHDEEQFLLRKLDME